MDGLTQMPVPGLDMTAAEAEREIRAAIYKTEQLVKRAISTEAKEHAQHALDALKEYARREGIEV